MKPSRFAAAAAGTLLCRLARIPLDRRRHLRLEHGGRAAAAGAQGGHGRSCDHRASVSRHHEGRLQRPPALRRRGTEHEAAARCSARAQHGGLVQPGRLERQGDARRLMDPAIKPRAGEWYRQAGRTSSWAPRSSRRSRQAGIKTVIICGNSFQGATVGTA